MIPLLLPHAGAHIAPRTHRLARLSAFFRRTLRMLRRKRSVPAFHPGAGAAVPPADRYACCVHCADGCPCDPRDSHLTPCKDGCNDAVPVLGDRMIADVRREYDLLTGTELTALRTRKVLPRADGDIVIDEVNHVHVCPWLPAQQPAWPALPEPAWPDVTMSDLSPARYVPDVPDTCCPAEAEVPTYGQVPVARVLEAERLAESVIA